MHLLPVAGDRLRRIVRRAKHVEQHTALFDVDEGEVADVAAVEAERRRRSCARSTALGLKALNAATDVQLVALLAMDIRLTDFRALLRT